MELFRTDQYYIFIDGENGLWWNRKTGEFEAKTSWELASADDPECLGIFFGIVGKIEVHSILEARLMLIKERQSVGELPGGKTVYKIKSVVFLQLGNDSSDIGLLPCKKHQHMKGMKKTPGSGLFDIQQNAVLAKTWGTFKSATNTIKNTTQQAAALATAQVKSSKHRSNKDKEKFERRILDELQRIFTETDSFYFSLLGDLTNSLQRQWELKDKIKDAKPFAWWKHVDDRFFWNKHMLQDIINLNNELADPWVLPIIQGFVQIEHCKVEIGFDPIGIEAFEPKYETFTLILISRRSRFRAGTRYKRRGVDEDGKCANYVETEQIVSHHHHQVSFVQVRGSVPVFWSQPGYKYRPPPRIDRGEEETQVVFEKHFEEELSVYGPVCIVSLVEQVGREKIIWDSYTNHILKYNSPRLTYATFDFHEYCRGMHFENVSVLVEHLVGVLREMGYCWMDQEGIICKQNGVFRINCIDCLDRTNVVQTALGKAVMEIQFTKLGLIPPEGVMPSNIRSTFQLLWANNGDIISKQYAGTNALKGDYTRTGERKFTGMMKDGMNSANRYYRGHFIDLFCQAALDIMQGVPIEVDELTQGIVQELMTVVSIVDALIPIAPSSYMSQVAIGTEIALANALYHAGRYYLSRFKDVHRQATIDLMLGNPVSEEIFNHDKHHTDEEDAAATAEHVKLLIEDCKKMLISDSEVVLGAWGLIDADPVSGDPSETEMDTILILTRDSYYVADYDDQLDRVTKYQRVGLWQLTLVELGPVTSMFKPGLKPGPHCLRLNYVVDSNPGYYHMFRSTGLRFFNNMAVAISNPEEMVESLKAICETITVGIEIAGLPAIPFYQGKLDRHKSKVLTHGCTLLGSYLDSEPHMTRNVSETQLLALKNVGTKALSNMSQQFNKLNRLGQSFNTRKPAQVDAVYSKDMSSRKPTFVMGAPDAMVQESVPFQAKVLNDDDDDVISPFTQRASLLSHNTLTKKISRDGKACDSFMPDVGIVMSTNVNENIKSLLQNECDSRLDKSLRFFPTVAPIIGDVSLSHVVHNVSIRKHVLTHSRTDLSLDVSGLTPPTKSEGSLTPSPKRANSITPEITIQRSGFSGETNVTENTIAETDGKPSPNSKLTPPNTLQLARKLSHSSGEVDKRDVKDGKTNKRDSIGDRVDNVKHMEGRLGERSSSERDLCLNITSSQSENAIRSIRSGLTNAITSPAAVTRDLVLSPFSKLAKGMQNLGANLDPRKLKAGSSIGRHVLTEQHIEEIRKLQERWEDCKTSLIAL